MQYPKRVHLKQKEMTAQEILGKVLEEPKIQEWDNGFEYKAKTTFKVESLKSGKVIDFVTWKKFNVRIGDTINSVGKIEASGKAFIGWTDMTKIIKRAE